MVAVAYLVPLHWYGWYYTTLHCPIGQVWVVAEWGKSEYAGAADQNSTHPHLYTRKNGAYVNLRNYLGGGKLGID